MSTSNVLPLPLWLACCRSSCTLDDSNWLQITIAFDKGVDGWLPSFSLCRDESCQETWQTIIAHYWLTWILFIVFQITAEASNNIVGICHCDFQFSFTLDSYHTTVSFCILYKCSFISYNSFIFIFIMTVMGRRFTLNSGNSTSSTNVYYQLIGSLYLTGCFSGYAMPHFFMSPCRDIAWVFLSASCFC